MKALLKVFSIDTVIEFVVAWLASTIKRPNSIEAQRVVANVKRLRDACDSFLAKVTFE